MRPIILASASPRRKTLLRQLIGDNFTVEVSGFDESSLFPTDPITFSLASSQGKAREVAGRHSEGVIIGADTIVVLDGSILGKPGTPDRAASMLKTISGKMVEVITGITVLDSGDRNVPEGRGGEVRGGRKLQTHEVTKVFIRELDAETIQNYVATGEPLDKAGAFGIQGKGAVLVERIEGDYFNVVGLPLFALAGLLDQVGIDVLTSF